MLEASCRRRADGNASTRSFGPSWCWTRQRVLQLASRPEGSNVRAHVWDALEVARNPHYRFDPRGYRSAEPRRIADRICCLAVAVEIRSADTLTGRIAERHLAKLLSCKAKPSSEILAGCRHL
jgi:hypothetical protein